MSHLLATATAIAKPRPAGTRATFVPKIQLGKYIYLWQFLGKMCVASVSWAVLTCMCESAQFTMCMHVYLYSYRYHTHTNYAENNERSRR